MLTRNEKMVIDDIISRTSKLREYIGQTAADNSSVPNQLYRYLTTIKSIQGNLNRDVSFAANLMAKEYLERNYDVIDYDAAIKKQCAPGKDIDIVLPDGCRLVAEIKTTYPCSGNEFGANQITKLIEDLKKLRKTDADIRLLFLTERKSYELIRKSTLLSRFSEISIVLLPEGERIVGSVRDASQQDARCKMAYRRTIEEAYYNGGFFNVVKDFDRFVREKEGTITLRLIAEDSQEDIEGEVNRRVNPNGTTRILGKAKLKKWFQYHFNIGEVVEVNFINDDLILLRKPD